jgi:hypothetical protein
MTTSQPPQPNPENSGAKRPGRSSQGERRIVTALFCDVTGSTAMAEQLDAEEWTSTSNGPGARTINLRLASERQLIHRPN